jgi:hypothetical protein
LNLPATDGGERPRRSPALYTSFRRNDDFVHLGGKELQVTVGETRKERDLSEVID